ncbi:MAG: helix-turn-helix transcriptional regulator [Pseudomonadota bacterium]
MTALPLVVAAPASFGGRLRHCRRLADESQFVFGQRLGVSRQAIVDYEKNRISPRAQWVERVCRTYRIRADWLLLGSGPIKANQP